MQPADTTTEQTPPVERIPSSDELRKRCVTPGDGSQAALMAVKRADEAMEKLSVNFEGWMRAEVARLKIARKDALTHGLRGEALEGLFSVSHDLKGQAATLGYPFAADVCGSLCRLIEYSEGIAHPPQGLVEQHVDAVAAMVRENAKGPDHPKASILARKLADVTDDYLGQLARRQMAAAE